jgi:hypothetical protein
MSKMEILQTCTDTDERETSVIGLESNNVCRANLSVLESLVERTSLRVCAGCGRSFVPAGRQRFCDHECYAASLRVDIKDRFWSKVKIGALNECWLWTAKARIGNTARFDGYGSILGIVNGKKRPCYSHRIAWELTFGAIPDGLCVLHACDVSLCCNPNHLFLGTQTDNMHDCHRKGRMRPRGHACPAPLDAVFERVPSVQLEVRGDLHVGQSAVVDHVRGTNSVGAEAR